MAVRCFLTDILPRELRDNNYGYLTSPEIYMGGKNHTISGRAVQYTDSKTRSLYPLVTLLRSPDPRILSVNRQIHDEYKETTLGQMKLLVDAQFPSSVAMKLSLHQSFPRHLLKHIRSIRILVTWQTILDLTEDRCGQWLVTHDIEALRNHQDKMLWTPSKVYRALLINFLVAMRPLVADDADFKINMSLDGHLQLDLHPPNGLDDDADEEMEAKFSTVFHEPTLSVMVHDPRLTCMSPAKLTLQYSLMTPTACSIDGDSEDTQGNSLWNLIPTHEPNNYAGFSPLFISQLDGN